MKIMKTVIEERKIVASVVCNKCGCPCQEGYYTNVTYSGGYESNPKYGIEDGDSFDFDLCEKCIGKLMREFKVGPSYSNYMFSDVTEWRLAPKGKTK